MTDAVSTLPPAQPTPAQPSPVQEAPVQAAPVQPAADLAPLPDAPLPAASDAAAQAVPPGASPAAAARDLAEAAAQPLASGADPAATQAAAAATPAPPVDDSVAAPLHAVAHAWDSAIGFLDAGGPAIWAIAGLSVATLALILWKAWSMLRLGAWSRARAERALAAALAQGPEAGRAALGRRPGLRGRMLAAAFDALPRLPEPAAREEAARVAQSALAEARAGLRPLELIATVAPLLGLLGTVLGMIAAFRTLQEAGGRADPAMLAGGIWEALLTTAAGMAVAIPASAALAWFESVADRVRLDMEDLGTRLFLAVAPSPAEAGVAAPLPAARARAGARADAA